MMSHDLLVQIAYCKPLYGGEVNAKENKLVSLGK